MNFVWSTTFVRAYKKLSRRHPELHRHVDDTLQLLADDPFHPQLRSHKLKGPLENVWACTLDYDNRLLFEFVKNPESGEMEILLLTLGTHNEVY